MDFSACLKGQKYEVKEAMGNRGLNVLVGLIGTTWYAVIG